MLPSPWNATVWPLLFETSGGYSAHTAFLSTIAVAWADAVMKVGASILKGGSTSRSLVGPLVSGSVILGLLVGAALIVEMPTAAQVGRSGLPAAISSVEWRFSEPQPDWKPGLPLPDLERTTDALRVILSDRPSTSGESPRDRTLSGSIYVDLPDWRREQWAEVVVRARATAAVGSMEIGLNPKEGTLPAGATQATFQARGGVTPIVRDGLLHTYRIHLDWGSQRTGPWRRVGLQFQAPVRVPAPVAASIDILSVRIVPTAIARLDGRITETMLTVPQLKSDFALFRLALEEAHPALYRFTTKRAMDAEFARAEAKLTRPMTVLQFHNVLAPVLAAIKTQGGIGRYQGDEISALIASSKLFPLALAFESERAVVVLNRGRDERVRPGMEVLAINGQSLAETLRRILPNLPQDGDVRTRQMYELGISDSVRRWPSGTAVLGEAYRLYIGDPSRFRTTLRDPQTGRTVDVDLTGVTNAEVAVNVEQNPVNRDVLAGIRTLRDLGPRQSIRYLDSEDAAVLVVAAFGGNFPDFLKETFDGLRSKGTKNLIIDLRGNTGGSAPYVALLFSYLTSKEFRQFERAYAKTNAPSFRHYTSLGAVDPVTDSYWGSGWKPDPNGGWLKTERYSVVRVQKPSENHFDGPVYVLIDGGIISAGSVFCAIADFHKRATFIGEETGGAAEGGTGVGAAAGELSPTLPASHLNVDIPAEAYFTVADPNNRRRGTLPKHAVRQTVDDLAKGRDTVLEFTRDLIRSGRGRYRKSGPTPRR